MEPDRVTRLLESADPVDTDALQGWARSSEGRQVLEEILSSTAVRSPIRTKSMAIVLVGAVLILGLLAATYFLTSRPTSEPSSIGCYNGLDQQANTAVFGIRPHDEGLGPAGICAREWTAAFGEPAPDSLVTCIVEGGGTGVFPNPESLSPEDACGSIGASLPETADFGGLSSEEVRQLTRDLGTRVSPLYEREECAPVGSLVQALRDFVRERALVAWSVQDQTSPTQEWITSDGTTSTETVPMTEGGARCADYAIDPVGARILVVNGWPTLPNG
jgi:hypothetical protein